MPDPSLVLPQRVPDKERKRSSGKRLLLLGAFGVAYVVFVIVAGGLDELALTLALLQVVVLSTGWRRYNDVHDTAVVVDAEGVLAPIWPGQPRTTRFAFADLHSFYREANSLVLAGGRETVVFHREDFVDDDALPKLTAAIQAGLSRLGSAPRTQFEARSERARALLDRPTPWTRGLVILLGLVFVGQLMLGAHAALLPMIRVGANVPALVEAGEWTRLISGNFLHAGYFLHLIVNCLALHSLGGLVERLHPGPGFVIIYFVSAVSGAAASTAFGVGMLAVGASTAVFGVLGALALHHVMDKDLPVVFRQPLRWWVFIGVLNVILPVLVPAIDSIAHAGGLVGGVLATLLVSRLPKTALQVGAFAAVAVTVFALGTALLQARTWTLEDDVRAVTVLSRPQSDPEALNWLAWPIAIDPDAEPPLVEAARGAAQLAHLAAPDSGHIADTLATLRHRLGRWEQAVTLERTVLRERDDAFTATQIARFIDAGRAESPVQLTDGKLTGPDGLVYVAVHKHQRLTGLLRAHLKDGQATGDPLPESAELGPGLLVEPGPEDEGIKPGKWRFTPSDEAVLKLP